MSLIVVFTNDGTGDHEIGNYDVRVQINRHVIYDGRVEGHGRRAGWEALLLQFIDVLLENGR